MRFIDTIPPHIEHFQMLGYWIVLLVSLLESLAFVGIVVPGAIFVVFAGSLAAKGYFDIGDLVLFATVGAVLGDGISFRLGRRSHILFNEGNRVFKTSHLERGKEFFSRYGGVGIFIGRFNGLIRAVVPFVAGLAGMNSTRFFLWNVTGAVAWAVSHLLTGYLLGEAWRTVEFWATRFGFVMAVILLLVLGTYLLKRFFEKRGRQLITFAGSVLWSVQEAIVSNAVVRKFVENHPDFFAFARRRFDRKLFFGLPLTLLSVSFIYVLLLLGGVIEDLLTVDPIIAADTRLDNLLFAFRDPLLVKVFLWVTQLGRARVVVAVALTLCAILALWRMRTFILPLLVTLAGSTATALLGKVAFHRPRPAGIAVYTEWSYSFPSGHAVIATSLYGFIVYLLWRHTEAWGRRLNILFASLFLMAAIGFSRLYLGVHFLSDVLSGYLLGLLWLIIGISFAEWRLAAEQPTQFPVSRRNRTRGVFLMVVLLAFYVQDSIHNPPHLLPTGVGNWTLPVSSADIEESFSHYHLPRHTETVIGEKREPISLIITADNDAEVIEAFRGAGWIPAEPVSFDSLVHTDWITLGSGNYRSAPIAPSFWNGKPNDLGFAKPFPLPSGAMGSEETRIWRTPLRTEKGKGVYVGVVNRIVGREWGIFSETGADLDQAREDLVRSLVGSGHVSGYRKVRLLSPAAGRTLTGTSFFSDGEAWLINVRF